MQGAQMKAVLAIAGMLAISCGVNAHGLDIPSAQAMAEGKLKYESSQLKCSSNIVNHWMPSP